MAATDDGLEQVYFVGGSDNPYNYDGVGYDGVLSNPSADIRIYDLNQQQWRIIESTIPATMDHRGLLKTAAGFYILGGMQANQVVTNGVIGFEYQ
ncbi:MAG: hypothetical protein R3E90_12260 [Marinicella sp.]